MNGGCAVAAQPGLDRQGFERARVSEIEPLAHALDPPIELPEVREEEPVEERPRVVTHCILVRADGECVLEVMQVDGDLARFQSKVRRRAVEVQQHLRPPHTRGLQWRCRYEREQPRHLRQHLGRRLQR